MLHVFHKSELVFLEKVKMNGVKIQNRDIWEENEKFCTVVKFVDFTAGVKTFFDSQPVTTPLFSFLTIQVFFVLTFDRHSDSSALFV